MSCAIMGVFFILISGLFILIEALHNHGKTIRKALATTQWLPPTR